MSKHTPGPWRTILGYDNAYTIITGKDYSLECVALIKFIPSCQANAYLIAAAPEMLDALNEAPVPSKYHGARGFETNRFLADYEAWMESRRAAIAKAKESIE